MTNVKSTGLTGVTGVTDEQIKKQINSYFTFNMPNREDIGKLQQVYDQFRELAYNIVNVIPNADDQYLFLTKHLECLNWVITSLSKSTAGVTQERKAG